MSDKTVPSPTVTPTVTLPNAGFSEEERKVALLLVEGNTRGDILRKLELTAVEVSRHEKAIREKILQMGDPDPVVADVIEKYELTRRESEILRLLLRGKTNPEIAADLFISVSTARFHVHNLLEKLNVESRHQLAEWAAKAATGN